MEPQSYDSGNINTLWLTNIYKNIENLEVIEKRIVTGYNEIIEVLQIPMEFRDIEITHVKYYSLKEIIAEMVTLITDIIPVITDEEFKKFNNDITAIENRIKNKELYMEISFNFVKNKVNYIKLLPQFDIDFKNLIDIRREIIRKIAHLLYIKEESKSRPW